MSAGRPASGRKGGEGVFPAEGINFAAPWEDYSEPAAEDDSAGSDYHSGGV